MGPDPPVPFDGAGGGENSPPEALFSGLYSELRRMASRELRRQSLPISLGATTLLHQAYIEMAAKRGPSFPEEGAFMSYAARMMRGLIIDYARRRGAIKRGGQFHLTTLGDKSAEAADASQLEKLSDALDELARAEPNLAEIVDLKFFCGFTFEEIATMKNTSKRTVQRYWEKARIYLYGSMKSELD